MENQTGDPESTSLDAKQGKKTKNFGVDDFSGTAKNGRNSHAIALAAQQGDQDERKTNAKKPLEKKSSLNPVRFMNAASNVMQARKAFKRLASQSRNLSRRTNDAVIQALSGLNFVAKTPDGTPVTWDYVEQKFDSLAKNSRLPSAKFAECIGMGERDKKFAHRLFNTLAQKHNITTDSISKDELRKFWRQISSESVQTFFEMIDENADGEISKEEVADIIKLSASANRLRHIEAQAEEYAEMLMKVLDPKKKGYIKIDFLKKLLVEAPEHAKGTDNGHIDQYLSTNLEPIREDYNTGICQNRDCLTCGIWFKKPIWLIRDNWQRVWVILLWLSAVVCLFIWKFLQYRNKAIFQIMGYCVCVAKGGAEILKLNMALILLPVCRNTITWLRNKTGLGTIVPLDDNINFHKVIAVGVVIGVILHAVTHLTCDFPRLLHATPAEYEPVKKYFGQKQPPNYAWFLKGVEGISGIVMVILMAIAFTLALPYFRRNRIKDKYKQHKEKQAQKKGDDKKVDGKLPKPIDKVIGFNAFWYSHHLFIVVYTLLIIHGYYLYLTKKWYQKTTWMYLVVPMTLYAVERLIRSVRSTIKRVKVLEFQTYGGDVLELRMKKPPGFKHKSGQYMFVKCSDISHLQWHPFSISSAPGDDFLSVHIKNAGDWTKQLRELFSKERQGASQSHKDKQQSTPVYKLPKILIDGPYGAPAQDYTKYEVVVLIGLGIGVTPMISIVRDIMHKSKTKDKEDEARAVAMENGSAYPLTAKKRKEFKTKKAYFYWVARQDSFNWFKGIEDDIKKVDEKGLIEMQYYCSNLYEEGDARAAPIALVQAIMHATKGVDVVINTSLKSHFGKPTWRKMYEDIAEQNPDQRIGVFYCGIQQAAKELRQVALNLYHEKHIKFDFHKENF